MSVSAQSENLNLAVLADLIADYATDRSATDRTQNATISDDCTSHTTQTSAGYRTLLTFAHTIPGRAARHHDGQNRGHTHFSDSRHFHP